MLEISPGIKDYKDAIMGFSSLSLFSSPPSNCSELRSQMYGLLQGPAAPDVIAMNFGSQPDWTRVIAQECPVSLEVQLFQEFKVF